MSSASKSVISKDEILQLAKLSNIELSDEEVEKYQTEVASILEMIAKLNEIDTEGVEPTYQVSGNKNVMREDEISEDIVGASDLLSLSPKTEKGQIKVPKVL
jgi:aspartyl-tRNA(Asn)/glutamyl-tRNA(Gln) amidotransferase subunit C